MKLFFVLIQMFLLIIVCVDSKPLIEELLQLLLPDDDYSEEFYPQYQQYPSYNNYYYPGLI
jgi:hypothetical protein